MGRQTDHDYALWSKFNQKKQWTKMTEEAITASSLLNSQPKDINKFCPKYHSLNQNQKIKFWTYLISIMAKFESGFNAHTEYEEKFKDSSGEPVISRGLLQLSFESAQQKSYACDFKKAKELHLAKTNLTCAVNILSYWVYKDKIISGESNDILGGGRYWSVLRPSHPQFKTIQLQSKALNECHS